jgi:catechol 2,3-dioxygenase-like lactoylglutathione lyase family enzyme
VGSNPTPSASFREAVRFRSAMKTPGDIKVLFVAGFGPIVRDAEASRKLYGETLRLPLQEQKENPGYWHTGDLEGVKHFALWPLSHAAQNCFGRESWPEEVPVPQAWLEFEVENIEQATAQLQSQGYRLLVTARKEPWGQTVTRFLGPEGLLVGVTHTPWMRTEK